MRVGRAARVAERGQEPLVQQVEARAAQQVAPAHELVRERRREPAAVALEPRQQPAHRRGCDTWMPRWPAATSSRWWRLVEDEPLVRRQHRRLLPVVLRLAHREVGREQVVVHDDDVRLGRAAPGPEQEAAVEVAALEARAEIGLGAHLVPHLRATASTGRSLSVPSAVWPAHSAMPISSSSLSCSSSVRCDGDGLVHPGEAEIVPPPLEQRERRRVRLAAERRGAAAAGPCPTSCSCRLIVLVLTTVRSPLARAQCERRHQVGERLPDPGAGLEQLDAAVVVAVGDVGGHVALAPPVLVLPQLPRHRAALAERVDHVERIDPEHHAVVRHLHDDVDRRGAVVDDAEAHPAVVQPGGDVEVGSRGIEPAARVVVQQHLAPLRRPREGRTMSTVPRATVRAPVTTPSRSTWATNETSRPPAAATSPAR